MLVRPGKNGNVNVWKEGEMEVHEFGCILKQMYNGCKYGEKAVMLHLFGIKLCRTN